MLSFHPLTLADKPWIDKHVQEEDSRSADFNFGNMYLWDGRYRQLVADSYHRLVILSCAGDTPIYPFPIGGGDIRPVVGEMRDYARAKGFPFVIRGLERDDVDKLEALFPGKFRFTADRDYFDYLYSAEKLATLSGKKLHGKRNHIHRFEEAHQWAFRPLTEELFPDCLALLDRWAAAEEPDAHIAAERDAIGRAFDHFNALGLMGGALFAEGRLIAFTLGEKISSDTFDVHFEKAEAEIQGAYPMINREFVRYVREQLPEIAYINREDDMGLLNLRQSKLSYYPDILLEKFTARWQD
ncbi:MAG: DUF2156 domain-containing protein [Oscillospiraceae bacterium]